MIKYFQNSEFQYLETEKQIDMYVRDSKKNIRVLKVIGSLNYELEFKPSVGRKQKISDLEMVVLSLTSEITSIDSKNSLFKEINKQQISNLIERSQFNKK